MKETTQKHSFTSAFILLTHDELNKHLVWAHTQQGQPTDTWVKATAERLARSSLHRNKSQPYVLLCESQQADEDRLVYCLRYSLDAAALESIERIVQVFLNEQREHITESIVQILCERLHGYFAQEHRNIVLQLATRFTRKRLEISPMKSDS